MEREGQLVPLLQTAACACASAVNATKDSTPLIRPGPSNPLWSVDRLESQTAAFKSIDRSVSREDPTHAVKRQPRSGFFFGLLSSSIGFWLVKTGAPLVNLGVAN